MRFQCTLLGGGYSMGEIIVSSGLGRGFGRPFRGGCAWQSDIQFAVEGGVDLGIPMDLCLVYSLDSMLIRLRILQLTSVGRPLGNRSSRQGNGRNLGFQ